MFLLRLLSFCIKLRIQSVVWRWCRLLVFGFADCHFIAFGFQFLFSDFVYVTDVFHPFRGLVFFDWYFIVRILLAKFCVVGVKYFDVKFALICCSYCRRLKCVSIYIYTDNGFGLSKGHSFVCLTIENTTIVIIGGVFHKFDCNQWALQELLDGNWNYDGQCNPFQSSYISDIIKKLENGETLTEKTIIMDEKGFDATTITQEDVDNYGI